MAEPVKLTYFNLRALAEPIRFILAYAEVDYEDNRLERESWPGVKESTPWGQLPTLQVGEKTLSQSNAISRYLAKKYNLQGDDDWEAAKMDELADALADFRGEWRKHFREEDEAKKAELKKNFDENVVPKYLAKFEAQISANGGPFLVGKRVSWIDFQVAHFMEFFELQAPGLLDNFPNLKKLKETVFDIPQIKTWIEKRPATAM